MCVERVGIPVSLFWEICTVLESIFVPTNYHSFRHASRILSVTKLGQAVFSSKLVANPIKKEPKMLLVIFRNETVSFNTRWINFDERDSHFTLG